MKKLLLLILSISSLTAFSQWQTTTILSDGDDCFYAFGKVLASDLSSTTLQSSTTDGATWAPSNIGVPATGLKFGTINTSTLYAFRNNNIYQSTTGNNWTLMTSAIGASDAVRSMAVISGSVLAVTNPVSGTGSKIYQLNGTSWALKTTITSTLITCIRNLNGTLWAGTTNTCVLKSSNAGVTFTNSSTGMSTAAFFDKYIYCMGATSSVLFAGSYGGSLYKSTNNGLNWSAIYQIGTGAFSIDVSDIYVMSANNILVACDSGFVYSTDGGVNFQKGNLGLNYGNGENYLNHITATPNYIIATTKSGTVVRRPITQVFTGLKADQLTTIESKVYPNPANGFATVEASDLMFNDKCEVRLNDILGREIAVFEMKEGKANLNLSNFSKGLYTYSVYNNKTVVSKGKLVVN